MDHFESSVRVRNGEFPYIRFDTGKKNFVMIAGSGSFDDMDIESVYRRSRKGRQLLRLYQLCSCYGR